MSVYNANKLLRDINRSVELARRCASGFDEILDRYDLTPEEREALKDWDVRKLYEMGVNPFLLMVSWMAAGKNIRSYIEVMGENE
jgi:hypothetical protein